MHTLTAAAKTLRALPALVWPPAGGPGLPQPHRMLVASQSELSMPCWQQSLRNVAGLHAEVLSYPLLARALPSHRRGTVWAAFIASATAVHHHPAALPCWLHKTPHALLDTVPLRMLQHAAPAGSSVTADTF